ncbi:MAG: hypothetical protein WCC77_26180, partial [Pseudolabrys sp.]
YHLPFGKAEAQAKAARWLWQSPSSDREGGPRVANRGAVLFHRTEREVQKMPMLFYLPLIVWIGLFEVAQDEMRILSKARLSTNRPPNAFG